MYLKPRPEVIIMERSKIHIYKTLLFAMICFQNKSVIDTYRFSKRFGAK